jgi:SAM-dependent methyltransferase
MPKPERRRNKEMKESHIIKDDVSRYNYERWERLVKANALFTRPWLNLDRDNVRGILDAEGVLGDVAGRKVLCLASGGGQQSVAFALMGASVSVLDLSDSQLGQDRISAEHYGLKLDLRQGDMRDLSCFSDDEFDIVWQPYSLNFVPDASAVFHQVSRIIREGGLYHFMCANPFVWGMTGKDWNGNGYSMRHPYENGLASTYPDQEWVYDQAATERIQEPLEYRQTLGTLVNGLLEEGFHLTRIMEIMEDSLNAEPGSWEHFTGIAPPWIKFWSRYRPDIIL